MPTVTCPRCGRWLTVSDSAPAVLSCPICLERIQNPPARLVAGMTPPPIPIRPLRVIPIEQQAGLDTRLAGIALIALAVILAIGSFLSFQVRGGFKIGLILAACALAVVMTGVLQIFYPESEVTRAASGTIGILAFGAFKVILICIGVLLLLFGACALLVTGASALG